MFFGFSPHPKKTSQSLERKERDDDDILLKTRSREKTRRGLERRRRRRRKKRKRRRRSVVVVCRSLFLFFSSSRRLFFSQRFDETETKTHLSLEHQLLYSIEEAEWRRMKRGPKPRRTRNDDDDASATLNERGGGGGGGRHPTTRSSYRQNRGGGGGGGGLKRSSRGKKFSSNIFLSANCKFLVLDTSESLKECLTNADKTLPLEDIVRLEVINKGANVGDKGRTRCPICLDDPPTSPVINACGHAVCNRCAQQLIARNRESEKSSVCPVCLVVPFVDADLRSCVLRSAGGSKNSKNSVSTTDDLIVGDCVTFELFEREKETLATRKCSRSNSGRGGDWPKAKAENKFACDQHSKYTTVSIEEVKLLSEEEVEALEREAAEYAMQLDRDETLYCFIAAESVKKRYNMFYEKSNIDSGNNSINNRSAPFALCNAIEKTRVAMETAEKNRKIESSWPEMKKTASPLAGKMNWATNKTTTTKAESSEPRGASVFDHDESDDDDDKEEEKDERRTAASTDAIKKYYFYQSSVSEKVVLHPVCMKAILSAHDDNFSRIPRKIKVNLLEIEKIIVDDAIRSRNPQWRHYSKTTELLVCEGDLRNICDRETLNKCEQIIKRAERRKMDEARRKKEDKKERERERKLEKERLEKEMAFARDILHRMPMLGQGNTKSDEEENEDAFPSSSQNQHQQQHQQQQQQQQNFALVAKFGFGARFHDMPSLAPDASSTSAFPSLGGPSSLPTSSKPSSWVQPAHTQHIDIDAALLKSNADSTTGKKKKNNKGTPLFSSSIGRRHV